MKSILITSPAAISSKLTIPTHQNKLYTQVTEAYQHMIHLRLLAQDQFAGVTMELIGDYSVWQVQFLHLHIISHSQDFQQWACSPYKFRKTWSASFHSHINQEWLFNLKFDYSETFGGFAWLHVLLIATSMPSQGSLIHSALTPKSCLWEHKRPFINLF